MVKDRRFRTARPSNRASGTLRSSEGGHGNGGAAPGGNGGAEGMPSSVGATVGDFGEPILDGHAPRNSLLGSDLDMLNSCLEVAGDSVEENPLRLSNFDDLDNVLSDIIVRTPARASSSSGVQAHRSPSMPQQSTASQFVAAEGRGISGAAVAGNGGVGGDDDDARYSSNPGRDKFFSGV